MLKLTTTVYKYRRYAPLMMVAITAGTILSFLAGSPLNILGIITLVGLAIYAGIKPKSIFSVRTVDERKLSFTAEEITWGNWLLPIHELENIDINIYAFDTFRHHLGNPNRSRTLTIEYGDRNTLAFSYRNTKYALTFYLGTFEHYDTLVKIMEMWREKGINFSAKSMFTDSYIREQVKLYG